ncbi:MAG: WG repeat-containing protein [Bacteroidota bacterium]
MSYHYNYIAAQKGNTIGILELSGKEKIPIAYDQIMFIGECSPITKILSGSSKSDEWTFFEDQLIHIKSDVHIKLPSTLDRDKPFIVWSVSNAKETKYLFTDEFYGMLATKLSRNVEEEEIEETVHAVTDRSEKLNASKERYQSLKAKVYDFIENYASYRRFYTFLKGDAYDNYLTGMYDLGKNREIIPPKYGDIRMIERIPKRFFLVIKDRKYGLYDTEGKQILPAIYEEYSNEGAVHTFGPEEAAILFSLQTGKKSTETYEFLECIVYNQFTNKEQILIKVKQNGVIFYLDAYMKAYFME